MPIRGKPERPHTSGNQGIAAEGLDDSRGFEFLVAAQIVDAPYIQFQVGTTIVDRHEVEFPLRLIAVDRKELEFAVSAEIIDVDGTEVQRDLFTVGLEIGGSAGYPSSAGVSWPGSVSAGQRVQRRGEVIPVAD